MNKLFALLVAVSIFLLIDFYLFQAVKTIIKDYEPTPQKWIKIAYWSIPVLALIISFVAFKFYPEYLSVKVRNMLVASIFVVYLSKIVAVFILFIGDIIRAIKWTGVKATGGKTDTITRSEFIAKSALAVGGAHIGLLTYGILTGAYDYRIRKVTLKLKNLPKPFYGMKIGQLSDIHSGSFYNKTAVEGGVDMLLAQKPDVVFFTGDLVNNEAKELNDYFNIFKKVQAPLGVYSTLGNHDYGDYFEWPSIEAKRKNLETLIHGHKALGWDILMDENRALKLGGETLGILGIQNWGKGGFVKKGNLSKALIGTEEFQNKLLLSHDPSHWRAQVLGQTNIDAAFAGHTHGMQYGVEIGGFQWSPIQFKYKEWGGLYEENGQQLYVNRGFGFLGYPGRVGILPEITIFELQPA